MSNPRPRHPEPWEIDEPLDDLDCDAVVAPPAPKPVERFVSSQPSKPAPAPAPMPVPAASPAPRTHYKRALFGSGSKKSIKAIRTRYNGYVFRSKLEACWAVFFDAAGIRYIYEQDGYKEEYSGRKYLPDFYLPDLDFHVEVKPERPGYEQEILRAREFIVWGGPIKRLLILSDVPPKTDDGGLWHFPCYSYDASYASHEERDVSAQWFFFWDLDECGASGNISKASYPPPPINEWDLERKKFSVTPMSDRKLGGGIDWSGMDDVCGSDYNYRRNRLTFKALEIAREVQFDHGQTPTRDEVQRRVYDEKGA